MLKLRVDVFVVEQKCAYPDLDGKDPDALHVFLSDADGIAAYLRVLPEGAQFADAVGIGRVIAARRGLGLGARVLAAGIEAARRELGAQRIRRATPRAFTRRPGSSAARTNSTRTAYRTWAWFWNHNAIQKFGRNRIFGGSAYFYAKFVLEMAAFGDWGTKARYEETSYFLLKSPGV